MRTRAASSRSAVTRDSTVVRLQERLAFRLLLVFLLPLGIIVALGVYAYRLSARLQDVEVLERVSHVDRIYADTHNVPWALQEYKKLAERYPAHDGIVVRLGALYHEDGQSARAVELVQKAIAMRPSSWEAHSTLAYIEVARNNPRSAITAGEMALKLNPADVQSYNNLAWIYATSDTPGLRNLDRALLYAEQAVGSTRCRNNDYLDTLAEAYRKVERPDEAKRILEAGRHGHPLCNPAGRGTAGGAGHPVKSDAPTMSASGR